MTADEDMVVCYNPGCQDKKFNRSENSETACRYHPQVPIFHDGIKRWPCCKKSSCDFSTLLSYPGCVQGPHNPEKPEPLEQRDTDAESVDEKSEMIEQTEAISVSQTLNQPEESFAQRDPEEPFTDLIANVMPSLTSALAKLSANPPPLPAEVVKSDSAVDLSQMMRCDNFGCSEKKMASEINQNLQLIQDCLHHPKPPIFHEGLQYWGCCQKKHTDFEKMRNQPGCTYGRHNWVKGVVTRSKCRYDHFDNPKVLTLNIYAKNSDPTSCSFQVNNCKLKVSIIYGIDRLEFNKEFDLFGTVDPTKCSVNLNATKVEVKLGKSPVSPWKAVELLPAATPAE